MKKNHDFTNQSEKKENREWTIRANPANLEMQNKLHNADSPKLRVYMSA